jgi:hypothetical protein
VQIQVTNATELIASLPEPVIYIEGDTFWSFVAKNDGSGSWDKNLFYEQKLFLIVNKAPLFIK